MMCYGKDEAHAVCCSSLVPRQYQPDCIQLSSHSVDGIGNWKPEHSGVSHILKDCSLQCLVLHNLDH